MTGRNNGSGGARGERAWHGQAALAIGAGRQTGRGRAPASAVRGAQAAVESAAEDTRIGAVPVRAANPPCSLALPGAARARRSRLPVAACAVSEGGP